MCKALSHDIVIGDIRLLAKKRRQKQLRLEGGRHEPAPTQTPIIRASGGARSRPDSRRRREFAHASATAALQYRGKSQLDRAFELASPACLAVFVSGSRSPNRRPDPGPITP